MQTGEGQPRYTHATSASGRFPTPSWLASLVSIPRNYCSILLAVEPPSLSVPGRGDRQVCRQTRPSFREKAGGGRGISGRMRQRYAVPFCSLPLDQVNCTKSPPRGIIRNAVRLGTRLGPTWQRAVFLNPVYTPTPSHEIPRRLSNQHLASASPPRRPLSWVVALRVSVVARRLSADGQTLVLALVLERGPVQHPGAWFALSGIGSDRIRTCNYSWFRFPGCTFLPLVGRRQAHHGFL